jgi:hypothetical protein
MRSYGLLLADTVSEFIFWPFLPDGRYFVGRNSRDDFVAISGLREVTTSDGGR